jgi:hypothetical protein
VRLSLLEKSRLSGKKTSNKAKVGTKKGYRTMVLKTMEEKTAFWKNFEGLGTEYLVYWMIFEILLEMIFFSNLYKKMIKTDSVLLSSFKNNWYLDEFFEEFICGR